MSVVFSPVPEYLQYSIGNLGMGMLKTVFVMACPVFLVGGTMRFILIGI